MSCEVRFRLFSNAPRPCSCRHLLHAPPHPCPARLQDTAIVDYYQRAAKLLDLFKTLTPPPTGNIDDLAKMASFAHSVQSPFGAEFDVERPVHVTLKDIGCKVVDFLTFMKGMRTDKLQLPQGATSTELNYLLQSYPAVASYGVGYWEGRGSSSSGTVLVTRGYIWLLI